MKVEAEAKIGVEVDVDCLAHLKGTLDYTQLEEEGTYFPSTVDKAPRLSISIVIWILSSDTETSAATPLGGGARKVLAK